MFKCSIAKNLKISSIFVSDLFAKVAIVKIFLPCLVLIHCIGTQASFADDMLQHPLDMTLAGLSTNHLQALHFCG